MKCNAKKLQYGTVKVQSIPREIDSHDVRGSRVEKL